MNSPEAYIQFKPGMITDDGEVTVEATEDFLRNYMQELHAFIAARDVGAAARRLIGGCAPGAVSRPASPR